MPNTRLAARVDDFLAQKRSAVAGVSREHDIAVIAGACPMMFGPGVDFGHGCTRWFLALTGKLPA